MRLELGAPVRALAASPAGGRLAAGGADGRIRLLDLASGAELWVAETGSPILRVGFVAGGESVVAVGRAEGSRHLGLPLAVHRMAGASGAIESFELSEGVGLDADGRLLLTYGGLWDAAGADPGIGEGSGSEPIVAFQDLGSGYGQVVRSAALSGDGQLVALGVRDIDPYAERGAGSLRLFEEGGRRQRWVREFAGGIEALAFSRGSDLVLTAGEDGTVRVIDAADGGEIRRLSHAGRPRAIAWHPAGESFATAGDDGELRLYRLRDAAPAWQAEPPPGPSLVALSADGQRLAALAYGDRPARAVVWEVGGSRLSSFELDPDHDFMEPRPLAFAENGERLLLASLGGGRERRASESGGLVEQRIDEGRPIVLIAESPDSRWIATGSWDQWLWIEGAGEWRIELSHRPTALAFTADSGRLLAGSEDGRVLVLDSATGERLSALDYPGMVTAVAADAEGRRVAIGGSDGTARVFDLAGGALRAVIPLGGEPAGLAFVAEGSTLRSARATAQGAILVEEHPLTAAALVRLACSRLTANLPASEWRDHLGAEPPRATCAELPIPPG